MKHSRSTCDYLGLSRGTMCPAFLTEAKVKPFSFQVIPATWSSCLCSPFTHHSLHWSSMGSPASSLSRWIQVQVPVMGTELSTSPSKIHTLRPDLMSLGQSQKLALLNMVYFSATSSLQAWNFLKGTCSLFWMVASLNQCEIPYMSSQMVSSSCMGCSRPCRPRQWGLPWQDSGAFWQRQGLQRLSMLVLVWQKILSAVLRMSTHWGLKQPRMQAALIRSWKWEVYQPCTYRFSYWQMPRLMSLPGSAHSRGSVQALPIMMPFRFIFISDSGREFLVRIQSARQGTQMPAQLYPVMQKSFLRRLGNLAKKTTSALQLSSATVPSSAVQLAWLLVLKPTPAGEEMQSRLAFMFQAQGLIWKLAVPCLKVKGPFSQTMPMRLEQPGPPLSHSTTGSLSGSRWESKKTQWKLVSSKWSMPEYQLWAVQPGMMRSTRSQGGQAQALSNNTASTRYFIMV